MKKWVYYNIHDLVTFRVEKGHPSEHSIRLMDGIFEVDEAIDQTDFTLTSQMLSIPICSDANKVYSYTEDYLYIKKYRLQIQLQDGHFCLSGKRDLSPFVMAIQQIILLQRNASLVHAAAIGAGNKGILLPGWGGTGKTCAILTMLREMQDTSFLADDIAIVRNENKEHYIYSYPKAFTIYPYHKKAYPHLFKTKSKTLIPAFLSKPMAMIRKRLRPVVLAFPSVEKIARKYTPEHMQVPAKDALPNAKFSEKLPLTHILFIERYEGDSVTIEPLEQGYAMLRMTGNFFFELGQLAQEIILALGSTGIIDIGEYMQGTNRVLTTASRKIPTTIIKMPAMTPEETGQTIQSAVQQLLKAS